MVNHPAVLKRLRVVNLLRVVFLVRRGPLGKRDLPTGASLTEVFLHALGVPQAKKSRSEKLQNESSPNFSNFCPGFCPEFWSEFSTQNSQANTKKIFTDFLWRAGKVKKESGSNSPERSESLCNVCPRGPPVLKKPTERVNSWVMTHGTCARRPRKIPENR